MRRLLAVLALTFIFVLPSPGAAATPPLVAEMRAGDADLGVDLRGGISTGLGFIDGNGNGRLDAADPDEPVYLDLDLSRSVSYGDLRFSPFAHYGAGTVVDFANRDAGRTLLTSNGWFARDGTHWFLDTDSNGKVSVADVRFDGNVTKVRAGDGDLDHALTDSGASKGSLWRPDNKNDAPRSLLERLYVDRDQYGGGANRATIGDLRIVPQGFGLDDEATHADVDHAIAAAKIPAPIAGANATSGPSDAPKTATVATAPPAWRTLDWILVVVGVANLAGLIVVGRLAAARHPKNPFK